MRWKQEYNAAKHTCGESTLCQTLKILRKMRPSPYPVGPPQLRRERVANKQITDKNGKG